MNRKSWRFVIRYHFFLMNILGYYNLIIHSDSVKPESLRARAYQIFFRMGNYNFKKNFTVSASIFLCFLAVHCPSLLLSSITPSPYIRSVIIGLCGNDLYHPNTKIFWINLAFEMNKVEQKSPTKPRKSAGDSEAYLWKSKNLS